MAKSTSILNYCKVTSSSSKVAADGSVTVGDPRDYYFQNASVYEDAEIAKRTGISVIPFDKWEGSEPLVKVEEMIRSAKIVRLVCEIAGTDSIKYREIYCSRDKAGDLLSDNPAKNLDGLDYKVKGTSIGKIFKVRTGNRDRFS